MSGNWALGVDTGPALTIWAGGVGAGARTIEVTG